MNIKIIVNGKDFKKEKELKKWVPINVLLKK